MLSGGRLLTGIVPQKSQKTQKFIALKRWGTLVTKMGCDAIATNGTKMGAMQSRHKGRSIKATKPLSTRSNGKTVANREGQRKKRW